MTSFSNTSTLNGLLEQTRDLARVDATQWSTQKVVNSCNKWLDKVFTYGIKTDRNFQLDDTNHTKLPIGTTNLVINQAEYSFLTDEQGNRITNITRIEIKDANGLWTKLKKIDHREINVALDEYKKTAGTPVEYDLTGDNIVKLYPKPSANISAGLKYYFQRTPSYFVATDTTKQPGVADFLHNGFVVASAYDCALSLGLENLSALSAELQKEEMKMAQYFSLRNTDSGGRMMPSRESNK